MVVQSNCSLLHNTLLKTLTPPRQCLLFSGFSEIKKSLIVKITIKPTYMTSFLIDNVKIKL